ncbi:MAG: hypothetical protein ACTSO9_06410 [Candidatus Helarchaeota archaeon]
MKIEKKLENIRKLLIEIFSILNLKFVEDPSFEDLAEILYDNNLINRNYLEKIKLLDGIIFNGSGGHKTLKSQLDDILMYLEMRFYHYI